MTALSDLPAHALFRDAVALVRSYPLDADDPPPALGAVGRAPAWAAAGSTLPSPADATPEIAGRRDDLWSAAARVRAGAVTAGGLAAESRARITRYGGALGAHEFVADTAAEVAALDADAAAGRWRGPLHGVPISIKDVIHVAGMPTSGSSAAYTVRVPAREGEAVRRLRGAGALFTGKVTSHEFALGVTTPQARNPWDPARIPGGSSGGSAIAVVTGMSVASLGTDTRASIRVPAALSGTVGFKPSFGLVPADGIVTLSWSMDHVAPMGRSVRDIALLMDVLTASGAAYRAALPGGVAGRRLVTSRALLDRCAPAVAALLARAFTALTAAGATVEERAAPNEDDLALANAAGMIVSRCEAAAYHAGLGTDLRRCTPETHAQLGEAGGVPATDYLRALRLRALLRARMLAALGDADALIMPTSKVLAPPVEHAADFLLVLSETCIPWSFVDLPAISLPLGMAEGLPVGIQLAGRPGGDAALLALAHGLEALLPPLPEWTPPEEL